jgi:hypothetical protein
MSLLTITSHQNSVCISPLLQTRHMLRPSHRHSSVTLCRSVFLDFFTAVIHIHCYFTFASFRQYRSKHVASLYIKFPPI